MINKDFLKIDLKKRIHEDFFIIKNKKILFYLDNRIRNPDSLSGFEHQKIHAAIEHTVTI